MKTDIEMIKELCKEHLMVDHTNIIRTERLGGLTNKNVSAK